LFSSLLPRRKKLIARQVKEEYAFIAESFADAVEEYGSFRFDTVKMIGLQLEGTAGALGGLDRAGSDLSRIESMLNGPTEGGAGDEEEDCIPAPDGDDAASLLSLGATKQRDSDNSLDKLNLDKLPGGDDADNPNPSGAGEDKSLLRADNSFCYGNVKLRSRVSVDPKTSEEMGPREVMSAVSISPANQEILNTIRKDFKTKLPSGDVLSLVVDKERFHCCEVLFKPSLFEGCGSSHDTHGDIEHEGDGSGSNNNNPTTVVAPVAEGLVHGGIIETILEAVDAVDLSVRDEVCAAIVLTGRTALVPGLVTRLTTDLHNGLSGLGVHTYTVVVAEDVHGAVAESFGMMPSPYKTSGSGSSSRSPRGSLSPKSLTQTKSGKRLVPVSPVSQLSSAPLWDESGSPNRTPDSRVLSPICRSRGSGAPSVAWAGASLKVQNCQRAGDTAIEPQNFVTVEDYQEHGASVLKKLLLF
jgi:hypothetical protein